MNFLQDQVIRANSNRLVVQQQNQLAATSVSAPTVPLRSLYRIIPGSQSKTAEGRAEVDGEGSSYPVRFVPATASAPVGGTPHSRPADMQTSSPVASGSSESNAPVQFGVPAEDTAAADNDPHHQPETTDDSNGQET